MGQPASAVQAFAFPFVTGWAGENHFEALPSAVYGAVLLVAAIAYYILQSLILAQIDPGSALATAFRHDFKGKISPILYAAAIGVSFFRPWLAACIYVFVALMWLIPDRRIERTLTARDATGTRPMSVQQVDEEGNLWFLSADDSHKNQELEADASVQPYFQGSAHSDFLMLNGTATISRDKAMIKELWKSIVKTWFTEDVDDRRITVLKVAPSSGYYWDTTARRWPAPKC